jgi:hypothetical protein
MAAVDKALYSIPHPYVGQRLTARADAQMVRIIIDCAYEQVGTRRRDMRLHGVFWRACGFLASSFPCFFVQAAIRASRFRSIGPLVSTAFYAARFRSIGPLVSAAFCAGLFTFAVLVVVPS